MAEAEQTFVENNEQQNLSLPDSDQHTLTVEDFDQQNITGDLQNEYELPEHDAEDQSLAGHEDNLTENDPENNFEMITEQDYVENENAQTLVEEQQDQGLDGIELKQEFPENENDGAPDDKQVDNKEEHENSSVGKVEEKKWPGWPGLSVFRMLVPSQKVGNIMGRKGEYIKKIVEETRARVKILDGPRGSQERAVMVSAKEEPDDPLPPAIDGLLRVHSRIVDGLDADASQAPPAGAKVSTKFLVPATQAGTLIGKQGATVKSIQEASSCIVRVLGQDALPTFALEDDRVVEVVGEPVNVHKAVELIAAELRKFLVDRSVIPIFEQLMQARSAPMDHMPPQPGPWGPPQGLPPHGGPHGYGPGPQYMQPPPRQHNNYYAPADMPPPLDTQHHQGITAYGREPAHAPSVAQSTPAMTTQIPQHMQVPLQYADAVIGANGSTISYVRRASGATVTIQETRGVPGEMTVEINGTPAQVQSAQQLIQNLMADAAAASVGTTQTGVAADQNYSQGYSAYAAPPATSAAPPAAYGSVYGSPASSAAPPAAYGSVYGGNYGY